MLLESNVEDPMYLDELSFLTRFPWLFESSQALDYINDRLDQHVREGDESTITLNRFTEPAVWVESIVQQLAVQKKGQHSSCYISHQQ